MTLDTIPAEFGRVIPQPMVRCAQCGRQTLEIEKDDDEPLCSVCRINDGAWLEATFARDAVHEIVVPIEGQNMAPPVFGTGSGEIDSCELVLSMRHGREVKRDARLCSLLTLAFCVVEGLLLIAAAALR